MNYIYSLKSSVFYFHMEKNAASGAGGHGPPNKNDYKIIRPTSTIKSTTTSTTTDHEKRFDLENFRNLLMFQFKEEKAGEDSSKGYYLEDFITLTDEDLDSAFISSYIGIIEFIEAFSKPDSEIDLNVLRRRFLNVQFYREFDKTKYIYQIRFKIFNKIYCYRGSPHLDWKISS